MKYNIMIKPTLNNSSADYVVKTEYRFNLQISIVSNKQTLSIKTAQH